MINSLCLHRALAVSPGLRCSNLIELSSELFCGSRPAMTQDLGDTEIWGLHLTPQGLYDVTHHSSCGRLAEPSDTLGGVERQASK